MKSNSSSWHIHIMFLIIFRRNRGKERILKRGQWRGREGERRTEGGQRKRVPGGGEAREALWLCLWDLSINLKSSLLPVETANTGPQLPEEACLEDPPPPYRPPFFHEKSCFAAVLCSCLGEWEKMEKISLWLGESSGSSPCFPLLLGSSRNCSSSGSSTSR